LSIGINSIPLTDSWSVISISSACCIISSWFDPVNFDLDTLSNWEDHLKEKENKKMETQMHKLTFQSEKSQFISKWMIGTSISELVVVNFSLKRKGLIWSVVVSFKPKIWFSFSNFFLVKQSTFWLDRLCVNRGIFFWKVKLTKIKLWSFWNG
jgi:hypothetical protein